MSGVPDASMLPPPVLLATPSACPGTDAGFALLVDTQWSQLPGFVLGALGVPIDAASFATRCGTFARQPDALACVDALKGIHARVARFGDPRRFGPCRPFVAG